MVEFSSVAVNGLSVVVSNPGSVAFVIFCVNFGLLLCSVIQLAAVFVLYKKTACASVVGLANIMLVGMSAIVFFVQLFMYVFDSEFAVYAVTFYTCTVYAMFILSGVYSIMLSKNSLKTLCILSGVFDLIPPVGMVLTMILSRKLLRDTPVQEYVYSGYAYTYAALGQFCAKNKAVLVDMAGDEEHKPLSKKQIKSMLKELKYGTNTAKGQFEYASSLAIYAPHKSKKAVKYMKRAADGGYAPALFNLGYYYELGAYVKKDLKKAKACYIRAAEGGDGDAELRLAILEIKSNNATEGLARLKARADEKNDVCAKYNLAICHELGYGVSPDMDAALDIYCDCVKQGLAIAERRIFAIAATDINSAQNGDFFRKVTDREFTGTFKIMIDGLIEIKKRHAADAADCFLKAVKKEDGWEGFARCLVGTLYIDCGKELRDKCNGAEFIKTAMNKTSYAKDVFAVIPSAIRKEIKSAQNGKAAAATKK
ncbi:MAG: sel1 repeat family protein [Clostridiales bacterium]|nr:sel1 repeat family protein [Clostridiales bacterium]